MQKERQNHRPKCYCSSQVQLFQVQLKFAFRILQTWSKAPS